MKIVAFGEVMLRLSPPEYLLLEQTNQLRMDFTGSGVNLLANLAHFGKKTTLLTALPKNRLGKAAAAHLRKFGINDEWIHFEHQHIGSYFAEMGYGNRATQVTYQNRLASSFGQSDAEVYDFEKIIAENDVFHICGISLSLTDATRQAAQIFAKKIHATGKKVCFDFNFRPSLNTEPNKLAFMKQQYEEILPNCDIVFGSPTDLINLLQLENNSSTDDLIFSFMKQYQIDYFAGTKRTQKDGKKFLQGYLYHQEKKVESPVFEIHSLDRIGAGDAFAVGILHGYAEGWELKKIIRFATMNGVLAHTIHGDVPLTTVEDVWLALEQPSIDLVR